MKRILFVLGAVCIAVAAYFVARSFAPSPSGIAPLSDDTVQVVSPLPEDRVTSPIIVRGRARGTWFFEGSFPVILTDWDGRIIAEVPAQAEGEWMTTDWVPFTATVSFTKPTYGERGALILKKDNPSGLPQYDDAREMTIFFK